MLALGFAAGLPYLLIFGTLSFWLREAGVNLSTIGFVSWVGGVFAFKWCWSPLVDRLPIPLLTRWLGRRRSWLLLAQLHHFARQLVDLLLLAVDRQVQLVEQVFAVAGLDFQFGQALVDVVGRCHPGCESLNQIGSQGLMGKR